MASELSLAEAALANAQSKPQPIATPPAGDNPFGQQPASFFPSFFDAAEMFPAAPSPPVGEAPSSQGNKNFFDVASSGDLDLTETKDTFGQFPSPAGGSVSSPFDTTFDFGTPAPSSPQQSFGVVEVQVASKRGSFFLS